MPPRLDAVGIVVSNLDNAIAFYRMLGAPFPDAGGEDHVEAVLPSGLRLMLDSESVVKSFDADWVRPVGQSIGLAFLCANAADVDATYAALLAAGHRGKLEPWDAFWGQRYAQVYDPDGHSVDLFAPL